MQLPDALSRLGYSKSCGESMVHMVKDMPVEQCTVPEVVKLFKPMQQTDFIAARAAAAGEGLQGGIIGLSNQLQEQKVVFAPQEESLEEESIAVQAYNTVLVAVVDNVKQPRRRSPRLRQNEPEDDESVKAKDIEVQHEQHTEADSAYSDNDDPEEQKVTQKQGSPSTEDQMGTQQRQEAGNLAEQEKPGPVLEVEMLKQAQQAQPMMNALIRYITTHRLPADRLERIRVLETAPLYEVNQAGLLCRIRERGSKGSLGIDMQVVVPEALQGTVVMGCHQGAEGHASVVKTFQKVRDRFYWPGMFMDCQRMIKYCSQCQLNSMAKGRAHITQHIEAAAPGECVVIDLLHYPQAKGYRYVLVAVDAYSRWAEVAPLQDKRAETVANALAQVVLTNTAGALKLIVSDQGSEFKGELAEAMKILRVEQRYTAAYRSEGHGLAERYNRSLSETLKSMVSQNDPEWHKALPWAKLAYNTAVHRALSDATEGLTPAEVHLGRRLQLNAEAGIPSGSAAEQGRTPSQYAQHLAKHVEAVKQWVTSCREKYQKQMRQQANKTGRKKREFAVGQSVRLQDTARKGTTRKLLKLYDGPYQVLDRQGDSEYTIQKIGEGKKVKFRVHD